MLPCIVAMLLLIAVCEVFYMLSTSEGLLNLSEGVIFIRCFISQQNSHTNINLMHINNSNNNDDDSNNNDDNNCNNNSNEDDNNLFSVF